MFFTSIKEIYRLRKKINRLLSKGIDSLRKEIGTLLSKGVSNICFKVTIEKNWCSQNLNFLSLKYFSLGQFLGSSNLHIYRWVSNLLVAT